MADQKNRAKRLRCWILIAVTAGYVAQGMAAKTPPDQVDIKAAYCIGMLRTDIEGIEYAAAQDGKGPGSGQPDNPSLAKARGALQRLEMYLTPRLYHLDTRGIEVALKRGAQDTLQANDDFDACAKSCPNDGDCMERCVSRSAPLSRTYECNSPNFIPF